MIPVFTPLIAFLLPILVIYRCYKQRPLKRAYLYSVGSFTAALAAVCIEVRTIGTRAAAGDFGGIADTIDASNEAVSRIPLHRFDRVLDHAVNGTFLYL